MQNLIEVQNLGDAKHWKVPILGRGAMLKDAIFFVILHPLILKFMLLKCINIAFGGFFLFAFLKQLKSLKLALKGSKAVKVEGKCTSSSCEAAAARHIYELMAKLYNDANCKV